MSERLSPSAHRVLQAVQADAQPDATARARGWELLQRQIPVDLGALDPPRLGAAKVAQSVGLAKVVGAVVVALALAGSGVALLGQNPHATEAAAKPAVAPAPNRISLAATPSLTAPLDLPPLDAGVVVNEPERVATAAKSPGSAKPAPLGLAEDAELLYAARAAFQSGNLSLAAQKLQEHARVFPTSQLRAARSLLRVKVLCGLGQHQAALDEAQRLRRSAPKSSEATGLVSTCAAP